MITVHPAADEPAPRSSSVTFEDVKPKTPQTCSINAANISDSALDANEIEKIKKIRNMLTDFAPPLNTEDQMLWNFIVEYRLKYAEGLIRSSEKLPPKTDSYGVSLSEMQVRRIFLIKAIKDAETFRR